MKIKFAFHPFLFAAYAVIGVFALNSEDIPPEQIVRPLIIILATAALAYFVIYRLLKNIHRSALLITLGVFWAVYFGHVYRLVSNYPFVRNLPQYRLITLTLWTAIIGIFALPKVWKMFWNHALLTTALNVMSVAVLILPTFITLSAVHETTLQKMIIEQRQTQANITLASPTETGPDIYYIIVDGYGRQDILEAYYKYDNQGFISYLHNKGFYVADGSQSNYMLTHLSLSSSLNFEYINDLEKDMANSKNRGPYSYLIGQNQARHLLKQQGYQFVNIESVALFVRLRDADIYLAPPASVISEFESLLLTASVADGLIERFLPDIPLQNYETHRKYIKYQFNTLSDVPNIPGKKFVFVHIWAPHPPFIFDSLGNPIEPQRPYFGGDASGFFGTLNEYQDGYIGELIYINTLLEKAIDDILLNSKQPPIIILQGDHGPGSHTSFVNVEISCLHERFSMLNAYYFPDGNYSDLSSNITPVNTFRVILNQYFGANLEMLENKNYFVTWNEPYKFIDVTGLTGIRCNTAN